MARPRIFISSTYYDLRHVRDDLERFITDIGYEPVLNERGTIPYGKDDKIEEYCYREIELCDILIALIGGRFGSSSQHNPYSISQVELKTALDLAKPVFIFVEQAVLSEFSTYKKNKSLKGVQYSHADDVRIYKFLEEVDALPRNNPIAPFQRSTDIIAYLREQWAGLFQGFLRQQGRLQEIHLVEKMTATAQTLDQLVTFLTNEKKGQDEALRDILLTSHPIFQTIRQATNTPYRVFFANRGEMEQWLKVRNYKLVDPDQWDDADYEEWKRDYDNNGSKYALLKIYSSIFDDNERLKIFKREDWNDEWISQVVVEPTTTTMITDEDIPF